MSDDYRVTRMFHPSHLIVDLDEAEAFYQRLYGVKCTPLAGLVREMRLRDGYPRDYSSFALVADVFFDMIDPRRYVINGIQQYSAIEEPRLTGLGWYVDGIQAAFRALQRRGVRLTDQMGNPVEGDEAPRAAGSEHTLFFTLPQDTGLRYQFFSAGVFPGDARTTPGWTLPRNRDNDPLGIERCSHHTIMTGRPARAAAFLVDALGGTVIHTGRNELLGGTSTYVYLAESVFELVAPDAGTGAEDTYHAITWKVSSLVRVEKHLAALRIRVKQRSENTVIVDAHTGLGIPWGFTTSLTPDDPRQGD